MGDAEKKAGGRKKNRVTLHQILVRLEGIEWKLREIEKGQEPKRFMNFWEAIPPPSIVQRAVNALRVEGEYAAFSTVLASYYQISPPAYIVDTTKTVVPPNSLACYVPDTNQVFSKEPQVGVRTAFHEFFHAMVAGNVVLVPPTKEQEYADKFADSCMKLAATMGVGC